MFGTVLAMMSSTRPWSDEELAEAGASEVTMAAVLRRLGYRSTSNPRVRAAIRRLALDTSHMTGQAWARGLAWPRATPTNPHGSGGPKRRWTDDDLVEAVATERTYAGVMRRLGNLRRRLLRAGLLENRCAECGIQDWRGEKLVLHLDHIDGDPLNNDLSNLRLLCPNCHSLTATYCGKNKGRVVEQADTLALEASALVA